MEVWADNLLQWEKEESPREIWEENLEVLNV